VVVGRETVYMVVCLGLSRYHEVEDPHLWRHCARTGHGDLVPLYFLRKVRIHQGFL